MIIKNIFIEVGHNREYPSQNQEQPTALLSITALKQRCVHVLSEVIRFSGEGQGQGGNALAMLLLFQAFIGYDKCLS